VIGNERYKKPKPLSARKEKKNTKKKKKHGGGVFESLGVESQCAQGSRTLSDLNLKLLSKKSTTRHASEEQTNKRTIAKMVQSKSEGLIHS